MNTDREKKTDRRILKTKKALFEAFDRLVTIKDYDKITISELAREADIDRKTFYLHYSSINEMVDDKMSAIVSDILDEVESDLRKRERADGVAVNGLEADAALRVFFFGVSRTAKKAFPRKEHLFGAMPATMLAEKIVRPLATEVHRRGLLNFDFEEDVCDLYVSSLVGAMMGVYVSWMRNGMAQPVEEVSEVAARIVGACLREIEAFPAE